jgi:hypothetical protein
MLNIKGISLSITAIVIIAVAVVVLVTVLGFFLGGFQSSGSTLRDVSSAADDTGRSDVTSGIANIGDLWKGGAGDDCIAADDCRSNMACSGSPRVCKGLAEYKCKDHTDCSSGTCDPMDNKCD